MSRDIVVRPVAQQELRAAAEWYDQKSAGLGTQFIGTIRELLDDIREQPERHAVVHRDIRHALANRFPYAVYYRVEAAQIVVIAVLHTAQDSERWLRRR